MKTSIILLVYLRWWINWKRHLKDVADAEREEELWNIASPVMAFNRWKKKDC